MKGFIIKDLLLIRQYYGKIFLILTAANILAIIFLPQDDSNMLYLIGIIWTIMAAVLPISTFSCDSTAKWERFALAAPISRNTLVLGKYVLTLILLLGGAAAAGVFFLAAFFLRGGVDLVMALFGILATLSISVLSNLIMLPFIFLLGAEKSRIISIILIGVLCGSMNVFHKPPDSVPAGSLLLALALTAAASYKISAAIYRKKEIV